ncbi:MAG: hypothetical protein ABJF10_05530 [Chthoniobacter sp.]|uniref:hypothetical protein n=1 Tax=Chthoniobacter sp. TaxID=2510640 RepID=UPI0032AE5DA8
MENDSLNIVQIVFFTVFVGTLILGGYVIANFNRFFGPDPNMPSETGSSRAYTKVQVVLVWLHMVAITGALAFLLH